MLNLYYFLLLPVLTSLTLGQTPPATNPSTANNLAVSYGTT